MGKIHVLSSEVSEKIAAGEAVERPASVIKELVENSIDAGASLITVEIKKGGSTYMRVSDNGSGMEAADAKICFLRHATSKIQTSSDLEAIYTLGFRGEALASIGAVSDVTLYTKRTSDTNGICVTCRGGEIVSSDEAGVPDGTSICVENLFYNTPARLKFLKKDATEAGYITDIITRFVFAHPEISFRLVIDNKEKIFSAGDSSLKNAVYTAYGKDYANGMLEVDSETDGIRVSGLIGKGNVSRPKRNYQSFYVNKRYITSKTLISALENAYKNQIMIGKFPVAMLNIDINPSLIDINVHPTKLEVKFSDERAVYNAVYYAVKNALYALPNVPKIERADDSFKRDAPKEQLNLTDMVNALPRDMTKRPEVSGYNPRVNHFLKQEKPDFIKPKPEKDAPIPRMASVASPKREMPKREMPVETEAVSAEETVFIDEYFEIVGQLFNTYIIAEKGDEMMLVDQHAAHERLKFEELKRDMADKQPMTQLLIEPVIVNMNGSEMTAYRDNKELFEKLGFDCEEFGDDAVIIRGVPGDTEMGETEPLMLELVAQGEALRGELMSEKYERLLYTIACKAAVKANMRMSVQEMEALVRSVLRLKNINTCPHGRPIIVTMSKKEIEKEFKRIV